MASKHASSRHLAWKKREQEMWNALNSLVLLSSLWNTSTNLVSVFCFLRVSSSALSWPFSSPKNILGKILDTLFPAEIHGGCQMQCKFPEASTIFRGVYSSLSQNCQVCKSNPVFDSLSHVHVVMLYLISNFPVLRSLNYKSVYATNFLLSSHQSLLKMK